MNKIFLVISVILLFACQHTIKEKYEQSEKNYSENLTTNINLDTTNLKNTSFDTTPILEKELQTALQDTTTNEYFIQVLEQRKLIRDSDDRMLSITDSLFSKDPDKDYFYFLVFTKSMNNSDGFYSEAVGSRALEFLSVNTESFARYFSNSINLTDNDLRNWANSISGEIQIARENEESEAIKELETQLRNNIINTKKEYSKVIEKLIEHLEIIKKERIAANT